MAGRRAAPAAEEEDDDAREALCSRGVLAAPPPPPPRLRFRTDPTLAADGSVWISRSVLLVLDDGADVAWVVVEVTEALRLRPGRVLLDP